MKSKISKKNKRRKKIQKRRIMLLFLISIVVILFLIILGNYKKEEKKVPAKIEEEDKKKKKKESILRNLEENMYLGENESVYVEDYGTGEKFSINSKKMQAASLIKLFIAGTIYENHDRVERKLGKEKLEKNMKSMIEVSDNKAADTLVLSLSEGGPTECKKVVNSFCEKHGYDDTSMGSYIFMLDGAAENTTSVNDMGKILGDLYRGEIKGSRHILEYMKNQERRGKIPAGIPSDIICANKTGELLDVEHDAAIVYIPYHTYSVCIMLDNVDAPGRAVKSIVRMSEEIYTYMYNLSNR